MIIPESSFVYIDIAIVAMFICFIIVGYSKGFVYEVLSLLYTAISIVASWFLAPIFASMYPLVKLENLNTQAELLSRFINLDVILNTVIYFVLIFIIFKILYILLSLIFKGMNKLPVLGTINKILGAVIGILNATIVTIFLSLLLTMPIFKNGNEIKNNTIFKYINNYSDEAITLIVQNVDLNHIKQQFKDFDINNAREDFKLWLEHTRNE